VDSPLLIRTREVFRQRNPPVIFVEMPFASELSPANLHHVLGIYYGEPRGSSLGPQREPIPQSSHGGI